MRRPLLLSVSIAFFSLSCFAAKGGSAMMGGVGFLFPDMNEFTNPGQMALNRGVAVQGFYTREDQTKTQAFTPSIVAGSGKWGGGVFARRTGTSLTTPATATDRVGGALGMSFAADRVTVGAGYDRETSVGQVDDGTATVSLNFNGKGRVGFCAGAKATSTINALVRTRTALVGIGYGFSPKVNAEAYYSFNNLDDTNNVTFGGSMSVAMLKGLYASGAYSNVKNSLVTNKGYVVGRLGFQMAMVDVSAHAEKLLMTGQPWSYGGSLRVMF
jgi:hypothetical protein